MNSHSFEEEINHLRKEVAGLKTEIEQSKKTNTQYLQNVAHQLTAPLNAIKWSIEAIRDESVSIHRKSRLLSSIYSQGTILVHLIKNFSLMSNLEADHELGQFRDKPETVSPLRLAINLANDFQPQAADAGKKIVVDEGSFGETFAKKSLLVEKNLIAQALSNLLENAVKYSHLKSTIVIGGQEVSVKGKTARGVSVESTGLPIPQGEIAKLTERGFRGTAAKQRIPAGTGIGLYLAKRIMEIHQGGISIISKGNQTKIILFFPDSRLQ